MSDYSEALRRTAQEVSDALHAVATAWDDKSTDEGARQHIAELEMKAALTLFEAIATCGAAGIGPFT